MASNSATKLATQQSIKAYVDSQVGTVDTLAEILANGNTTGSTDIDVDAAQKVQFRDAAIYINSSVDGQLDIVADTEIQIAATTIDINGAVVASGEISAASLDISGDVDIDGTLNVDAIDIDGAVQLDNTLTVGVDDTGYDVKFYGATGGAYMLWDESADDLILAGAGGLVVAGNVDFNGDLDVDGTTNLDVVDIDGAVDMASTLTVAGVLTGASLDISGDIDVDGTTNLDVVDIDGAVDMATTLTVAGNVDFNGDLDVDGTTNLDVVDIDGAVNMATTALVTGVLTTTAATVFNGGFASNADCTITGANSGTLTIIAPTDNAGLLLKGGFSDAGAEEANIGFYQNTTAKWQLGNSTDNGFKLYNYAQTNYALTVDSTGGAVFTPVAGGHAVFNEGGVDADFRVESDGNTHMLFVDGGSNEVGIGTSAPGAPLQIQTSHTVTDVTAANTNSTLIIGNSGSGDGVYNAIKFAANQQDMYIMSFNDNTVADRRLGFFLGSVAGDAVADERLSILGDGKVGVGTISPDAMFTVDTNVGGSSTGTIAKFHSSKGESDSTFLQISATRHGTPTVQRVQLQSYDNDGSTGRILSLNAAGGNVGVGSNTPASALEVTGTFSVRSSSSSTFNDSSNAENVRMLDAGTIFNADGIDKDFTVQTDTVANGLHVNGQLNLVACGINDENWTGSSGVRFHNLAAANQYNTMTNTSGTATDEVLIIHRQQSVTGGEAIQFYRAGSTVGSITVSAGATAYNTSSDYRLKENVVDFIGATDLLKQLKPKRFSFIEDGLDSADTDGFLAHEVQAVVPKAITGEKDGTKLDKEGNTVPHYQSIDQSKIVPLLVATIQELEARIAALES
jgi:hypothetical protein